jgi:hypothetical protein
VSSSIPGSTAVTAQPASTGRTVLCATYGIVGYQSEGGYAELAAVPARNLIALPPQVSFTDGAAFPLTFLTAWHMLVSRAHVREGETVLVMAAGSGVGQAAIQVGPPARRSRDRDRQAKGEARRCAGAGRRRRGGYVAALTGPPKSAASRTNAAPMSSLNMSGPP